MRIVILGAGAVGGLLGGLLAYIGGEVYFSGNQEALDYMKKQGLRIRLPHQYVKLEPSRIATISRGGGSFMKFDREPVDFIFITVRRYHLKDLSLDFQVGRVLKPQGKILFFNCHYDDIRRVSPEPERSLLCLSLLTAVMLQPGDVELASPRSVLIYQRDKNVKKVMSGLKGLGIDLQEVDDIEPYANSFFLWQLLFLPVAMCYTTYANFLSYSEGREIAYRVLKEGLDIFTRMGRPLKKLTLMDPQDLLKKIEKGGQEFTSVRCKPDRAYNSLLQSMITGKMTETRELNGKLIKMAAEAGVDPLWNWKLTQKQIRVLRVGYYKNPAELYKSIK